VVSPAHVCVLGVGVVGGGGVEYSGTGAETDWQCVEAGGGSHRNITFTARRTSLVGRPKLGVIMTSSHLRRSWSMSQPLFLLHRTGAWVTESTSILMVVVMGSPPHSQLCSHSGSIVAALKVGVGGGVSAVASVAGLRCGCGRGGGVPISFGLFPSAMAWRRKLVVVEVNGAACSSQASTAVVQGPSAIV
jgi:hypothetical protein